MRNTSAADNWHGTCVNDERAKELARFLKKWTATDSSEKGNVLMNVKQGLLWTFKKGGQFETDELTITVVDILEKRVKLSARINGSDITCFGPASFELQMVSMTLRVEEVGPTKTKLRILSRQKVTIRRE